MRTLSALAISGTLGLFVACGGGDPIQGPTDSNEDPTTLSFAAVAGEWEGTWDSSCCGDGLIEASLNASAGLGEVVGTADWLSAAGDFLCNVDWIAVSAAPPRYDVEEDIVTGDENCSEGTLVLQHDATAETLTFEWENFQGEGTTTGTLSRTN